MKRLLSTLLLLSSLSAWAAEWAGIDFDPIFQKISETNDLEFLAVRPFYSKVEDPEHERWVKDYLWPVYTRKGFKGETYGRFLFFGWSHTFSPETERKRTWVLPFYFKGVSAEDDPYFALFPFGGTIDEIFGRDKVMFILFPLYAKSHINDVHTTSILWPIGSRTVGPRVHRARVWPIYGTSTLEDEFNKKFVFWPFYHSVEYTNARNPGGGFILVPIYGRIITEQAKNYWYIPPFGRYTVSADQRIIHAPWPFVQLADGVMYKRIFWPIYGKKKLGTLTRQFWLWPIFWKTQVEFPDHLQERRFGVPFFYSQTDVMTKDALGFEEGEAASRYWKVWPLMSWDRRDGTSRFRTLDLWPMRNTPGIERNWAPWWTLYRRMDVDGEVGHHLLWGLYRQTRSDESLEWSLLKGVLGYKKEQNSRRYRFLFMWFGADHEVQP
ncbi:hypothetical protein [Pontiella sulfatireligans]|uniref:Uncharacterized protein n=1 Tax=Pontiella sulfatireligans TaxID=2750658 RepID=A0A6C2URA9_9BACT|nr:hypothetical protein [Pontiella sulfatireligans]VGO22835.1 hypothetical protein SCARR_04932 [Pontiella sulfatireligans]